MGAERLPVSRPVPGRRSHVVVRSEQLDKWIEGRAAKRGGGNGFDLLDSLLTTRKLRHEVRQAREELHHKIAALRKEMATLRARRRISD